jgi:hypothetical protein
MKSSLHKLLVLFALPALVQGADITSAGDWVETITAANLIAGAGSNLPAQFESVAGVTSLTITNAPGAWTLRGRRAGNGGHGDVTVFVKRTSSGSGAGGISGGTAYVELTGADTELFSGTDSRSGISLQFKLTGISTNVAPTTYFSSILFTVQ